MFIFRNYFNMFKQEWFVRNVVVFKRYNIRNLYNFNSPATYENERLSHMHTHKQLNTARDGGDDYR